MAGWPPAGEGGLIKAQLRCPPRNGPLPPPMQIDRNVSGSRGPGRCAGASARRQETGRVQPGLVEA
jgi:hypothetical protein